MIKYRTVGRKKPGDTESPMKYYASTALDGEVGLQELCEEIERISTVSEADIMAVLISLVAVVPEKLINGKIVRLGDLGDLRPSISSNGTEKEEEVKSSMIKGSRVVFKPSRRIKKVMQTAEYRKA